MEVCAVGGARCFVGALGNANRRWKTNDNLHLFTPRGYFLTRQMFGLSRSHRRLIILPGDCAAKLCKRWSLAGSEHAGLGMGPAQTTNQLFISCARPGGRSIREGGAEVEHCFSKPGLHTLTSGGSGSNAVAVKFYPRHFKSKFIHGFDVKRCLLLKDELQGSLHQSSWFC